MDPRGEGEAVTLGCGVVRADPELELQANELLATWRRLPAKTRLQSALLLAAGAAVLAHYGYLDRTGLNRCLSLGGLLLNA